ncbi:MAG: hypothetical protein KME05_20395 [Gloeocapsa sp. UFS-A4-WI-NPMV-4B04]|jgi:hypothetical protein|nr:hypothetical protein [Gloeocapsa sp. UFS-A4-WI-NPMV-4B04]
MCSEDRPLKTQKLTLEIDVTGGEEDFARCEQLGEAFVALVTQMLGARGLLSSQKRGFS